jgi:hypothetical protein
MNQHEKNNLQWVFMEEFQQEQALHQTTVPKKKKRNLFL